MSETPPSRITRIRGWVLIVLGSALLVGLFVIRSALAPGIAAPGTQVDGGTFTGTREEGAQILWLLNVLLVLSAAFIVNGVPMALTGRVNKWLQLATLAVVAVAGVALYETNTMLR